MTTWQAVLIFAGAPTAVFALVTGVVLATNPRPFRGGPGPVIGLRPEVAACIVRGADGDQSSHAAGADSGEPCWTARCAECGRLHRDGDADVHFTDLTRGLRVLEAHG